jgi:phosphate transport system ATP-binding protein
MVRLRDFSCGYGERRLVEGLDIEFKSSRISAIVGRSGAGKSTILKAINRLHEIEESPFFREGRIEILHMGAMREVSDIDAVELRRKVGYIFQSPVALPMSIRKNVSFALDIVGIRDEEAVREALEAAYLWDEVRWRLDESAHSLSVGQRQRLAIARALVCRPDILLFDEPTSALDTRAAAGIEKLMLELKKSMTIILVSHDMAQVERVCDTAFSIDTMESAACGR